MALTPGQDSAVHNLHGTIYQKVENGGYIYHAHAPITAEAKLNKPVWTIWREEVSTGNIVPPEVNSAPSPDGNLADDMPSLTYWTV